MNTMRLFVLASASLLVLAACGGGGDHAAIVDACMAENGADQKTCDCMADTAEKELSGPLFSKLAKAAREGGEGANDVMAELSGDDQAEFVAFAMKAAMTCSPS